MIKFTPPDSGNEHKRMKKEWEEFRQEKGEKRRSPGRVFGIVLTVLGGLYIVYRIAAFILDAYWTIRIQQDLLNGAGIVAPAELPDHAKRLDELGVAPE